MKRKIFVSINIPEKTKKRLSKAVELWQKLPIKWVREENLHITLVFLGFVSDDLIAEICEMVKKAAKNSEIFDLEFTEISLAPDKSNPKKVWLAGKPSEELKALQEDIEKSLEIFVNSKKSFSPHITLGKIRAHKWDALETKPEVFRKFPLVIEASSVDVVASDFAGHGPEYTTIESCPLS